MLVGGYQFPFLILQGRKEVVVVGLLVYVRGNGDQEGFLEVVAHRAYI